MPGEVQGTVDQLGVHGREAAAGLDDRAHEAGANDRTPAHQVQVGRSSQPGPAGLVPVGEPGVLHPASPDDLPGLVEQLVDAVQLGQPRGEHVVAREPPTFRPLTERGQDGQGG